VHHDVRTDSKKMKNKKKKNKIALITGITGQDGSYMADLLLEKGYEVHGIMRRSSSFNTARINHLYKDPHDPKNKMFLHYCDLSDTGSIRKIIFRIKPDEIYHFGAQSHVRVSFDIPEYTADITGVGVLRMLEAIKDFKETTGKSIKFYQASSSEMFGIAPAPQNEKTPFHPRSPYGCAKAFAYHVVVNYRESYGIFAVNGILFNHESPRRGETFVTRKITRAIGKILKGKQKKIYLGNLDAKRDWGYAPDYMEAAWLMLQQKEPDDYIVATGETYSVREFLEEAFKCAGLGDYKKYVEIDPKYFRPAEVDILQGDASKAQKKLGWKPKVKFKELVKIMVNADIS